MRNGFMRTVGLLAAGCGLVLFGCSFASASVGDGDPSVENTVRLEIQISGLGPQGAKIAIKPAHPSCNFKAPDPIVIPKGTKGEVIKLKPIAVAASTTSADRDCSFEITITEPGQDPKVFRRGLRLATPPAGTSAPPSRTLKCYLPATAVAVKDNGKGDTKRK